MTRIELNDETRSGSSFCAPSAGWTKCMCGSAFLTIPWLRAADMRLSERTSIPGAHAVTQSVDAVEPYFGDVLSQPIRMNERSFNKGRLQTCLHPGFLLAASEKQHVEIMKIAPEAGRAFQHDRRTFPAPVLDEKSTLRRRRPSAREKRHDRMSIPDCRNHRFHRHHHLARTVMAGNVLARLPERSSDQTFHVQRNLQNDETASTATVASTNFVVLRRSR